jgi:hypothetical protein
MTTRIFVLISTFILVQCWASLAQNPATLQNRGQEKSNWCWNACSEMILDWHGTDVSQTQVADWAVAGADVGNYLQTGEGGIGPWKVPFFDIVFFRRGVNQVLRHFGNAGSEYFPNPLTLSEAQGFIDQGRPFIYAISFPGSSVGHVGVVKGYVGALLRLEDPWPIDSAPAPGKPGISNVSVNHSILLGTDTISYLYAIGLASTSGRKSNWMQTLVYGKSLDLVFLIDSTGSMGSSINNVKSQATALLNLLKEEFNDLRVAVVDYRDYPQSPYGAPSDYLTNVRTAFTTNTSVAASAINAISAAGGADWPEAVFSAVYRCAEGSIIGGWREEASVRRHIVMMGDAPGHSPEPFPGGRSFSDCVAALNSPERPVSLQALLVGSDSDAASQFGNLTTASGGRMLTNVSSSQAAEAFGTIFNDIAKGRFPVGEIADGYPTFEFPSIVAPSLGGGPSIKNVSVQIQTYDQKRERWRNIRRLKVPTGAVSQVANKRLLPVGNYRWLLTGKASSVIPTYPDGSTSPKVKGGKFTEDEFTEFARLPNPPGTVTKFTPTTNLPSGKTFEVFFEDQANTDAFAIRTVIGGKSRTTIVRRARVGDGGEGVLSAVIKVKPNESFSWYIQGLNYDRKRADSSAWN